MLAEPAQELGLEVLDIDSGSRDGTAVGAE